MQEPLREIFEIYEEKVGSHPMTREERAVWNRAQASLGENMVDEMVHAQSRSLTEAEYDCFRMGFRLGAQLMLSLR
ncbi:MAG: hypothetical protein K2P37_11380 [Oscillospiraceae bacterium]|jgi:hypothetical protein|nr:hypothetical protein [Oscillospiraceae bacterium]MCI9214931.1 hypothetical protein [Oscillospiraceae bacterium]MDE6933275.1 hypothetical protein [Oscillospiraceae bacterium]